MSEHDVVIVGGGPAGATAAASAARAGLHVLLLEAGAHPRPHVGESLLPGIIPILADIDALEAVEQAGFGRKTGSTLWNWGVTPRWDLWFADSDAYDHAWLVERSRFDAILFDAARRAGAEVRERAAMREVIRDGDRVVGVRWRDHDEHETRARFVVDASGPSAALARRAAPRRPIAGLQHQAMWAHFEGVGRLPAPRSQQALFVARPSEWWWLFPISETHTSIGVVQLDSDGARTAPRPDFDAGLAACSELAELVRDARRVTPIRHERDWSYRMDEIAGPGWIAVGDAAGFIDPVLSTGVMLAMHSGWHAARTIADVVLRGRPEPEALADYRDHHRGMFDDLLRMVRFYYQQNLGRDDYFWESKRILVRADTELRPQKAFVILTSGLVENLALAEVVRTADHARRDRTERAAVAITDRDPAQLGFVCLHLRRPAPDEAEARPDGPDRGLSLFVLIEPRDPVAPALFRTRCFDLNAIAPRVGNDPIQVPEIAAVLHLLRDRLQGADDGRGDDLAAFWRRERAGLLALCRALPGGFALVRAFGE